MVMQFSFPWYLMRFVMCLMPYPSFYPSWRVSHSHPGITWLSPYYVMLNCIAKSMTLKIPGQGYLAYLAYIREIDVEPLFIESIPVVFEFKEVFPTDLLGPVAYRLALPCSLSGVHPVFNVCMLKKYYEDQGDKVRGSSMETSSN
ncbi:hypothetical protein MTR67_016323 [Solanum verrucosum]|uniref:Tf2-1-like SH3-like domain-containing protein n=1 Tax=Solanum verrucosum TaxID=315347 RepID=A0AAF0QI75_SOLVR|nr:hypothetical protein MTR67_016323 [Solanum verrucosum]